MQINRNIIATKSGGFFFLLMALVVTLNFNILQDIASRWVSQGLNGPYAHGPLLMLMFLYICFKTVKEFQTKLVFSLSRVALVLLVVSQVLMLFSLLIDIDLVQHLILAVTFMLLIWAIYSYSVMVKFIYPFLLLLLALPIWGVLLPVLQKVSLTLTSFLLSTTKIPFYQEDFYLFLPNGTFEVAPSCAGLQQFLVAMILGVLYAYMRMFNYRTLLRLVLLMALVAIILNSIRIFIIVLIGYNTEMTSSIVAEHVTLGWVVFAIGMYLFMYIYERLSKKSEVDTATPMSKEGITSSNAFVVISIIGMVLIFLMPVGISQVIFAKINQQKITPAVFTVAGWQRSTNSNESVFDWLPEAVPADVWVTQEYTKNNKMVYIYVNEFQHFKDDYEPINITNRWVKKISWKQIQNKPITIQINDNLSVSLSLRTFRSHKNQKLMMLSGYIVNGQVTHSLLMAKQHMLLGLLQMRYDVKIFSIVTRFDHDTNAKQTLIDFFKVLKY